MKNIKQTSTKPSVAPGKQRSYNEIIDFLDQNWATSIQDTALSCIKKLDQSFGNIAKKLKTILVSGTNGKSLTLHFASKLLREEGLTVGTLYRPHMLTYNERISLNNETLPNKTFTELGNEVINMAETLGLKANSDEILTMMTLLHFHNNKADVVLLEVSERHAADAANICNPLITAITRITQTENAASQETIKEFLSIIKKNTHVISADQSKLNLQKMQTMVEEKGATWSMPIRKLAPLAYPFEQLHGRCAALAERIAHVFVNEFAGKDMVVVTGSLLTKQKGQRGRPTLEAKRQSELNPRKTVEQFWKEAENTLPGRFQLLDKEKPSVLIDSASNLDAFKNLLLGVRLLHYQRPLKGLTLVIGGDNPDIEMGELLKLLRYFFKKTSGQVVLCPITTQPGHKGEKSWDIEKLANEIKNMKVKAKVCNTFKEAFETAQKTVDDRHGLVVVTGSSSMVTEYWRYKGIKKL